MGLEVREDPRIQVDPGVRRQWTEDLLELGALAREAAGGRERAQELNETARDDADVAEAWKAKAADLLREWGELTSRTRRLRGEVEGWVGPMTQQQVDQRAFYEGMLATLTQETDVLEVRVREGTPAGGGE